MLSTNSKNSRLFALVDCNNFYVSCERVFRPDLREAPIVVLSNNDGIIIARSNEAKTLGIGMGEPYFKAESFIKKHGVRVFSSNYTLYGDMSHRVMEMLRQFEPEVEVYSIDEAFITLPSGGRFDHAAYVRRIKDTVRRCTGIPVSIGIAPSKTLAKLAGRIAKKDPAHDGVFDLTACDDVDAILAATDVADLWGIGRRSSRKLFARGIRTALDLKNADDAWIRKRLTVTGLRIVWELRGIPCIALDDAPAPKKGIVTSKSFGRLVESLAELTEAVAVYTSRAAEKLRAQGGLAHSLHIFINTNRFKTEQSQYANSVAFALPEPTASTPVLIRYALMGLNRIYRPGHEYQKAGVMLTDIVPASQRQGNLFEQGRGDAGLMRALDRINSRWGRDTVQYAVSGFKREWDFKRLHLSKAYTTRWDQLPVVKASD